MGRGRPKGSKDGVKRTRRTKAEMTSTVNETPVVETNLGNTETTVE